MHHAVVDVGERGGVGGAGAGWGSLKLTLGETGWRWCALVGVGGIVLRESVLELVCER